MLQEQHPASAKCLCCWGLCGCMKKLMLWMHREDAPEEGVGWRTGMAMRRRSPQENGRSMLLKQHTVSGTWQDTTGAKE